MEMHLHTRNISAAAMYMKEQRSTQLKILVVGIAGIKLQKVRLSVIYDRVRNRKNNFEILLFDFFNEEVEVWTIQNIPFSSVEFTFYTIKIVVNNMKRPCGVEKYKLFV